MEIGAKGDAEFAVNAIFDRVANAPKGRFGGGDGATGWVGLDDPNGHGAADQGVPGGAEGAALLLKLPGGGRDGRPRASATRRWWCGTWRMGWSARRQRGGTTALADGKLARAVGFILASQAVRL
jgi:hypothetical protein